MLPLMKQPKAPKAPADRPGPPPKGGKRPTPKAALQSLLERLTVYPTGD